MFHQISSEWAQFFRFTSTSLKNNIQTGPIFVNVSVYFSFYAYSNNIRFIQFCLTLRDDNSGCEVCYDDAPWPQRTK